MGKVTSDATVNYKRRSWLYTAIAGVAIVYMVLPMFGGSYTPVWGGLGNLFVILAGLAAIVGIAWELFQGRG